MKRDVCWRKGGGGWNVGNVRREGGCLMWDGMGWSMVDGIYGVDCDGLMA